MKEIGFDNKTRKSALSTASSVSTALNFWQDPAQVRGSKDCAIEEILYKPYCLRQFNSELIA